MGEERSRRKRPRSPSSSDSDAVEITTTDNTDVIITQAMAHGKRARLAQQLASRGAVDLDEIDDEPPQKPVDVDDEPPREIPAKNVEAPSAGDDQKEAAAGAAESAPDAEASDE